MVTDFRGVQGFWYAAGGAPLGWYVDGIPDEPGAYRGDPPLPGPAALHEAINAERDRRLRGTLTFQGHVFGVDQVSLQRITGAATLAGFAIAAGAQPGNLRWHGGPADFGWIAADNTLVPMDAQTCFAFGQAAAAHEAAHVFAARALKDADPIPANWADDAWWP